MKNGEEDATAALVAVVLLSMLVLVLLPVGYVVKVIVQTESPLVLGISLFLVVLSLAALFTQAPVLMALCGALALVDLLAARAVEVSYEQAGDVSETSFLPFEGYHW